MSYDANQRSPYGQQPHQPPFSQPAYGQPHPAARPGVPPQPGADPYAPPQAADPYAPPQAADPYAPPQPYGRPPGESMPPADPYAPPQPYASPSQFSQQPPQLSPRKKPKWPWILGGIILAGVLGCAGLFAFVLGGTGAALNQLDGNSKGKNAAEGKMNAPIADGTFEFTVTGMKCGVAEVGDDVLNQQAQGQYCLIDVSVKNVGKSAAMFTDISQTAFDAGGNQYSADSGAGVYANKDSSTFLQQINPGNTVKGRLVFDVPPAAKLTSIVLHESMFSAGVKIPLS
ncbi:DUF4352 domain-containing protein [Actinoplanes sp. CA-142083]|uniref:DUF4352 domain-containing protein n=1 Tax=Actinoplanes sp. CA-142083 TaxID=3239903 RepID=UPI003D926572